MAISRSCSISRVRRTTVFSSSSTPTIRKLDSSFIWTARRDALPAKAHALKVAAPPGPKRTEIRELVEIFRARVVDVGPEELMVEISGRESKIEAFIQRMRPYGILELVRTGRIAMVRGKSHQPKTEEEAEQQDTLEAPMIKSQ